MDAFEKNPDQYLTLDASGLAVGLPDGLMGNSEVGHLNIGAGRAIYQVCDVMRNSCSTDQLYNLVLLYP